MLADLFAKTFWSYSGLLFPSVCVLTVNKIHR